MKMLINLTCAQTSRATGIERFALHMAQEIVRLDSSAIVIASEQIPQIPNVIIPKILTWSRFLLHHREYIVRALWDQSSLRRLVARHRPDVVFFPIQDGLLFPQVKQIVTVHDLHYLHFEHSIQDCRNEISRCRTGLYRYKMPYILGRSAAVIAVSESTRQDIISSFGIDPDKIHVIHNGYDDVRFRVIENPQPTLNHYGLKSGTYFLVVGSILKHKNIVRLVQAFASLDCKVVLAIVGVCKDPDYLAEIKKVAGELGVSEERLRYLGYVPDEDLPSLYNGAISYLLPSLHEGFGVPIIEAMACGTPVVTSNCSSMPEIAGDAALLVDPYSVESIAAAMLKILNTLQRAETLRKAGLERAKMFRWSNSAQKLYDLCKSVSAS
jgi:glycosyltransferase involved in cell wall biosynthesis